jgi:cytochrome c biogenesis protein CcmG, thiol:disulfide interchange protein DsbE
MIQASCCPPGPFERVHGLRTFASRLNVLASGFSCRIAVITSLGLFGGAALALEKGAVAPDFVLPGSDSNVSLASYRGKVVYLDFWASWCGPCKQSFPWMNAMQAKYGAKGLQVVSVNVDTKRDAAARFLVVNPASFAVAFDPQGRTPGLYAVKAMPSSYLIGRDGRITLLHRGYAPEDAAALEQEIRMAVERTQ